MLAVVGDDVVVGDRAFTTQQKAGVEPLGVWGIFEGSRVLSPALGGTLPVERFVGLGVIHLAHPVLEAQGEGLGIRIDPGVAIEAAQGALFERALESLHLAVALGIGGGAVDELDAEPGEHRRGVGGNEAGALVQEQRLHQAMVQNRLVQVADKQLRALAGADEHGEAVAGGVVEETQSHPA